MVFDSAFLARLERRRQIGYRRVMTDVGFEEFGLRTLRTSGGLVA